MDQLIKGYSFLLVLVQLPQLVHRHLIRQWCSVTHTFFLSCSKIIMTLEDVAIQLLLPILGDTDPNDIELSAK